MTSAGRFIEPAPGEWGESFARLFMWTEEKAPGPGPLGGAAFPRNLLLQSLSAQDFERLSPLLQRVALSPRRVVQHVGVPIEHMYFVEDGLVSVLTNADEHNNCAEAWLIGPEGVIGAHALLGTRISPLRYFVQIGGHALRIGIEDLNRAVTEMPRLRAILHAYLHAALVQSAQSAACGVRHSVVQRLARWLLTAEDRSGRDELPITQDLLARSLGVRRPTVSEACMALEQRGVLAKERGLIRIIDRAALEEIACRCYRLMRLKRNAAAQTKPSRTRLIALSAACALLEMELLAQ